MAARCEEHGERPFEEVVDLMMQRATAQLADVWAADPFGPTPAVVINVTSIDDERVAVVRRAAAERALTVVYVDEREQARPGTVRLAELDSHAKQVLRSAMVTRAAGEQLPSS